MVDFLAIWHRGLDSLLINSWLLKHIISNGRNLLDLWSLDFSWVDREKLYYWIRQYLTNTAHIPDSMVKLLKNTFYFESKLSLCDETGWLFLLALKWLGNRWILCNSWESKFFIKQHESLLWIQYDKDNDTRNDIVVFSDYDKFQFELLFSKLSYSWGYKFIIDTLINKKWLKYIDEIKTNNMRNIPSILLDESIQPKRITRDQYYGLAWLCYDEQKETVEKDFTRFSKLTLKVLS